MAKRLDKTLADYVAIAIGPLLIMVLVGSLVFFLLDVSYAGTHAGRLRWILFWFVIGAVLIARIGIEQGKEHAALYGLALAGAVSLVVFKFAGSFALGGLCLLGVVWWCANKLTWDCTLIDEKEDASGEGLLQVSGLERPASATADRAAPSPGNAVPFWKQFLLNAGEREGRPHAPGLWVVYFSLAALPLFGIGQALIPRSEAARRESAFQLLAIYVTAGLGLLLTTSFLGLRRYLRQRNLQMPAAMTGTWLVMGSGLVVALLVLCLLLPRPEAEYTVAVLMDQAAETLHDASRFGMTSDDAGQGEGRRVGRAEENGDGQRPGQQAGPAEGDKAAQQDGRQDQRPRDPQNGPPQAQRDGGRQQAQEGGEPQDAPNADQQANAQDGRKGEDRQNAEQGDPQAGQQGAPRDGENQQAQGEPDGTERQNQGPLSNEPPHQPAADSPPSAGGWLTSLLATVLEYGRYLIYAVLAIAAIYLAVRHWERIVDALRRFWSDLLGLFSRQSAEEAATGGAAATVARPKPFADFANPFSTGAARRLPPDELVRYTFAALEAWAVEQRCARGPMQTPLEFGQRLADEFPDMADDARQLVRHYAALAYADKSPPPSCRAEIERLWRAMTAQSVPAEAAL